MTPTGGRFRAPEPLTVTRGQIEFEWRHVMEKPGARDPKRRAQLVFVKSPRPHPLFRVVRGDGAPWEKSVGLLNGDVKFVGLDRGALPWVCILGRLEFT